MIFIVSSHKNIRMFCKPLPDLFLELSVYSRAFTDACIDVILIPCIGNTRLTLVIDVNVGQKIRRPCPYDELLSVMYPHFA